MSTVYADDDYGYEHLEGASSSMRPENGGLPFVGRAWWTPLLFLPAILLCALSWMDNGDQILTDAGFTWTSAVCLVLVIGELRNFTRRFGVGGIVLYGGVLIWFSHDYFYNWFGGISSRFSIPPVVAAKEACLYSLFIMMMSVGLLWQIGRPVERWIYCIPDFPSAGATFIFMILFFAIGVSPFFWDTREPFYQAIPMAITAGRHGGPHYLYGRTGNVATGWQSYIGHITELGALSGLFAAAFAILQARTPFTKAIAWSIWLFELALGAGSGTRGNTVAMLVPVIGLLFIKHHANAALLFKRYSARAYLTIAGLGLMLIVLVQFQGTFRNAGLSNGSLSDVHYFKPQGNLMFSEAALGYSMIPDRHPFFRNRFLGEGIIRPMPEVLFQFLSHPIPRVIWPSKPLQESAIWYSKLVTGESISKGAEGTTISHGLPGSFYFEYGIIGMMEGGVLMGWLMGMSERWLRLAEGRVLPTMTSLGIATCLFRCFRDLNFIDFWALLLGIFLASGLCILLRPFTSGSRQ